MYYYQNKYIIFMSKLCAKSIKHWGVYDTCKIIESLALRPSII